MNEWQEYARRLASLPPQEREAEVSKLTSEQRRALEEAQRTLSLPPPPPLPPPSAPVSVAPARAKRKIWPWVLGCGCLPLLLLILLFVIGIQSEGGMAGFNKRVEERRAERKVKEAAEQQAEEANRQAEEAARKAEQQAAKASAISAVDLVASYDANEIAADQALKNKQVTVKGRVGDIGKDLTGSFYVTLEGPETSFRNAQCFFAKSDEAALARLSPGQRLTVQCTCQGLLINVLLKDCEILE